MVKVSAAGLRIGHCDGETMNAVRAYPGLRLFHPKHEVADPPTFIFLSPTNDTGHYAGWYVYWDYPTRSRGMIRPGDMAHYRTKSGRIFDATNRLERPVENRWRK